jgi:hypothetical protein
MSDLWALATATVVVALALGSEAAAQEGWQTATGPEGSFTVEMPAAPAYEQSTLATSEGVPYTAHSYTLNYNDAAYVAQTLVYPQSSDVFANPKASLQRYLNNYETVLDGGKWTSVDWLTHQGLDAV